MTCDRLAGGGGALEGELHQGPVVDEPVGILELLATGGGGLRDRELVIVHEPDHAVGVAGLRDHSAEFARPLADLVLGVGVVIGRLAVVEPRVEAAVAGVGDHGRAVG